MRNYEVFNQTVDRFGQAFFKIVGSVDVDVPPFCMRRGAERAGAEAIKVYSDRLGQVFAVKAGSGFVILQRPQHMPERVAI